MNAKFEKWWDGRDMNTGRSIDIATKAISEVAWYSAIQSLEVTPELVELACTTFAKSTGVSNSNAWFDDMDAVLTAVLSALKEQAK